jgi:hypothetical protein
MKQILIYTAIIISIITLFSCNKTKQSAKTLQSTTWNMTALTIDGVADTNLAELEFGEGNIYKEVLTGKWHNFGHSHGASAPEINFAWQFRDKGKTFEISNQSEGEDALQCSQLSGVYKVENSSKTEYEFGSSATIGYNGKKVVMKMKKN